MEKWHFGMKNDYLISLVLNGKKRATCSLYDGNASIVGEKSLLTFDNEKEACITETKEVIITEFKNINEKLALLEGEGTYIEWKNAHRDYFKKIYSDFNDNTIVEFEIFDVVENLVQKRLDIGKSIANINIDLFGKDYSIKEINAGFNNSIFGINNKYIIKVCDKLENEKLFNTEVEYYKNNIDNDFIPKLYKYDNSKVQVPFMYEIIEKIDGESVYYHWYKMNESERESFMEKLMNLIIKTHIKEYNGYDWCKEVKNRVLENFNKCKNKFNNEEQNIILESLELYDKVLSNDNRFCLIHNDLHFDNIFIDKNNNIKIIDFNDSIVAPFDYDLRILYMCVKQPWKWANIEMDPYQKPKDYKNIFEYVKKYYFDLNNTKYLNERMIIYNILNDIECLPNYNNKELIENVINNSKLLIELLYKEDK